MFVCLGWEVRLLDEGIEFFWNLIHWLMGWIGWAGAYWKEECVGDVCCPQLSAAWSIPARRWSVLLMRNDAPSTVHSVRARLCVYEGSSLSVLCLCVRVTLPQWSGSFLPLHVFLPPRYSLLWKFSRFKTIGNPNSSPPTDTHTVFSV